MKLKNNPLRSARKLALVLPLVATAFVGVTPFQALQAQAVHSRKQSLKAFEGYYQSQQNKDNGGDTYVAITEFGEKVRAQVLLSYGNASQPGSKHAGDQLKLLSEKRLREALLEKQTILKHLEAREEVSLKTE